MITPKIGSTTGMQLSHACGLYLNDLLEVASKQGSGVQGLRFDPSTNTTVRTNKTQAREQWQHSLTMQKARTPEHQKWRGWHHEPLPQPPPLSIKLQSPTTLLGRKTG